MKNEKIIKGCLKKYITITQGILVLFLMTGGITYSLDIVNNYENREIVNFNNNQNQDQNITVTKDNVTVSNLGSINTQYLGDAKYNTTTQSNKSNTIQIKAGILNSKIINSGIISTETILDKGKYSSKIADAKINTVGNSIYGDATINNEGFISSNGTLNAGDVDSSEVYASGWATNSLNGVRNSVEKINKGKIIGNGNINGGNAISKGGSGATAAAVAPEESANGIYGNGNIINDGIISGKIFLVGGNALSYGSQAVAQAYARRSGNGIVGNGEIINHGTISGYSNLVAGKFDGRNGTEKGTDYSKVDFSGNGISFKGDISNNITNSGVIKGSESAIAANSITGTVNNYGILSGREIFGDGLETIKNDSTQTQKDLMAISPTIENNYGVYIKLNNDENRTIASITNGIGGMQNVNGIIKTIVNGQKYDNLGNETDVDNLSVDSYTIADKNEYNNYIFNGAGISHGSLHINSGNDVVITDSVLNGASAALSVDANSTITLTNTILNGGGLKGNNKVISGFNGDKTININGTSVINGNISMGVGNDALSISNDTFINGNLDGGVGTDILNLGEKTTSKVASNLNIFHEINNFENISTNGDITLFEVAKVTGADEINLESGNLILRVDPTITLDGKVTGHALYGNNGTLSSTGGNLVIGLNGIGANTTVSMGGTTITSGTNDSWWKDTDHIKTNSLVLDGKLSDDGKDVNITIKEFIPLEPPKPIPPIDPPIDPPVDPPVNPPVEPPTVIDSLLYEKLNKVYQSTVTAGEIGALANTTLLEDKTYEESLGGLLTILDQIYANNPYAYTLKSSRDSLKLFEDNMSYLTIKPKENEWIIQGKGIYTGVKNDNASSGKNYYGFDTGHRNYKTTTSTSGGLATFEYGLSDKTSIGGVIGGNNQDINFKGSSKIKGNSLYLGTFAKTDINNFKLMAGLGYQYTAADADRSVSNMYDSFKTSDKYDINSLNAFAEVKYSIEGNDNWTLEPKARLSYYYIEQDNVNEGYTPGQLSIAVDKANSNTADLELVIDLIKNVYLQQGKLKNIFSFGIINTIGDKSKELNGYVLGNSKDGNKFDIQGVELPRTSGKVAYNLELEQTSGMIYTAGVSMEFAKDYNRNASATIGLGYKFNSISDLIPSQTQKTKIEKINIIKIDSNVTFDFDSSNLKVNQREELKKISENLSKESVKGQIKIVGHTDNIGSKDYNQKLSEKRAKVVATKLKSNMKLENIQYDIKGEGETKPLNSNSTKKERSENRRVEVIFSNEN